MRRVVGRAGHLFRLSSRFRARVVRSENDQQRRHVDLMLMDLAGTNTNDEGSKEAMDRDVSSICRRGTSYQDRLD